MPILVEDLGHRYNEQWVFRSLNARFDDDISVAIIGPSGVGKTTLVSILGGLVKPTEGSVLLQAPGTSAVAAPLGVSDCAWIFQTTNVFPNRSVSANVVSPLVLRGWRRDAAEHETADVLDRVGLSEHQSKLARKLSGGEVQRLGIARALATRSPIVIADEPTGQLDSATTEQVLEVLVSARRRPSLLLVVTHDPAVAKACDQEYVLDAAGFHHVR